ncbi:hypothetical protein F4553_000039 [Allocatelliglobosispora scoriae]|uniref:Uncharacterized protein n=1 Tax=Allocatelliglobosispora scoriae TaxID=643052 RepID=A0A841BIM0_9ACTN|nr:hypothetical protein [Allocatelliglobosispora scoriae]MBB5866660.1 hypothetical protein [Allocatelliglobosispora scoriae]
MGAAFLSFLEAIRRGFGEVNPDYAGWLVPRDQQELAILDAAGATHIRLPGWVRDEISDRIAEIISRDTSSKSRARLAELARYYLRPLAPKDSAASRASLSNWRHDAQQRLAEQLMEYHASSLEFQLTGLPRKGEHLGLAAMARDPAVAWIQALHPQERDMAIYRALADAANEARTKADARALVGVALIASRLAPATNPEPVNDFDGTPLHGMYGRKFTRSRLALPLVLLCLHRSALVARRPGQQADRRTVLVAGYRLAQSGDGPAAQPSRLSVLDEENTFDPDLLAEAIAYAWQMISTGDAKPVLAAVTRYAALASGMVSERQHQELALLSVAVARRHSDRRALGIDLHHPDFRSDSTDSILFQLRFRRERLLLASHHDPGSDWRPEIRRMEDLLAVRRQLLPAEESSRMEKVLLHLQQGVLLRQARELTAAGQPMDTLLAAPTEGQIMAAIHAVDDMVISMRASFDLADRDADQVTAVNAHRRKTEADGVVHLLSRIPHPEALAGARRLRRDLNRLDEIYSDQLTITRADVTVLWLLAMADQAIRHNETEQARHYLTSAIAELPDGIPHLAIRAANIAAYIGDNELTRQLITRIPESRTWPSYLRHLITRLRSVRPSLPT